MARRRLKFPEIARRTKKYIYDNGVVRGRAIILIHLLIIHYSIHLGLLPSKVRFGSV